MVFDAREKHNLLFQVLDANVRVKLELYNKAIEWFKQWQEINRQISEDIKKDLLDKGLKNIRVIFQTEGTFEHRLTVGSDTLVFVLHSNIFKLNPDSSYARTDYVREDPTRAYGALVYIYNFLYDTLYYFRLNDVGVLVGRVFVNKDGKFFVEGQRQMGFLYTNWLENQLTAEAMRNITYSALLTALAIELKIPPYAAEQSITLQQFIAQSGMRAIKTARPPGFHLPDENKKE